MDYSKTIKMIPNGAYILAVISGDNNTGLAIQWDRSEVRLIYGKTDAYQDIQKMKEVLEAMPDTKEDSGL